MFSPGEIVIKVIVGGGFKTATIQRVNKVTKKGVFLKNNESQSWDPGTGMEKSPAIPGFYSEIITLDGDEEDYIKSDLV